MTWRQFVVMAFMTIGMSLGFVIGLATFGLTADYRYPLALAILVGDPVGGIVGYWLAKSLADESVRRLAKWASIAITVPFSLGALYAAWWFFEIRNWNLIAVATVPASIATLFFGLGYSQRRAAMVILTLSAVASAILVATDNFAALASAATCFLLALPLSPRILGVPTDGPRRLRT
jgi:hypothetical protein